MSLPKLYAHIAYICKQEKVDSFHLFFKILQDQKFKNHFYFCHYHPITHYIYIYLLTYLRMYVCMYE